MKNIKTKELKRKKQDRNWLAKFAHRGGAGQHIDKHGVRAPRVRQKRDWKKKVRDYCD